MHLFVVSLFLLFSSLLFRAFAQKVARVILLSLGQYSSLKDIQEKQAKPQQCIAFFYPSHHFSYYFYFLYRVT
jgi:hypothetical protein